MRWRSLLRPGAMVGLALLLAGCASTSVRQGYYLAQFEQAGFTNATAYRATNRIALRFPLQGRDAYALAEWAGSTDAESDYQRHLVALRLDRKHRAVFRQMAKEQHPVSIRPPRQWHELKQTLLPHLVPQGTNRGVLVLVLREESVLYRDAGNQIHLVSLENKPKEVQLTETLDDTEFAQRTLDWLERYLRGLTAADDAEGLPQQPLRARNRPWSSSPKPTQSEHDDEERGRARLPREGSRSSAETQFLFATGADPAFAFFDLKERLAVFLSHPLIPEIHETTAPPAFPLRAFNSLVLRTGLLSLLRNPVTLINRGLWHLWHSGVALIPNVGGNSTGPPPPLASGPGMDLEAWEKELDTLVSAPRSKARLDFLIDGAKFFPAFIESIRDAEEQVDVQVFIFDNDDYAVRMADLLKEKSREARVRVLTDEMGSLFASSSAPRSPMPVDFRAPRNIWNYLEKDSRVRARRTVNPWLTMDHIKIFAFDGRKAYLGGMNIGREYRYEWHDMIVEVTGPLVGRLQKDFNKAWAHAGFFGDCGYCWVSLFTPQPWPDDVPGSIALRPLYTRTGKRDIYHSQLQAIRRARRYIYIENAYLGDDTIVQELIQARRRGVDVRVILPARNDSGIMALNNQVCANAMLREGIRVFGYPGMSHVKAAIYDGWACLGSANFTKMSLRIGQELNIGFSDPATVERLKRELFEVDFQKSRELTEPAPVDWTDYLIERLTDLL